MQAVLDRIENDMCVLEFEDGRLIPFPKDELPQEVREGDVLTISFQIDREQTEERRKRALKLMEDVWED
jgi:hypothetical protein